MTTGKDTASFFENGTTTQFEFCFKLYPQALKLKAEKRCKKPQDLIRLDEWYQNELPKLIKARGKDAHMQYEELVQTMKWKQSRGKFYPQLSYLVKVNTPRAVMQETKKAFRKLPNLEQAITALSNLKGVGTTMASALLAAAAPHSAPFMADECLMAIPEIEGIDYTTKEYLNFVQHIQATVDRLNTQAGGDTPFWSPHRVELALWAHYVANDLSPELLDEMPGPGAGGGANTNGSAKNVSTVKLLADGSEDTNDADDESLGAAAGRSDVANNIATESETENENTNSTPMLAVVASAVSVLQDGDSNFVSNDSTSQEPIIDENTTQTTATTSTDEGGVGTPLASDSESNLEAPNKLNAVNAANNTAGNVLAAVAEAQAAVTGAVAGIITPILPTNNGNSSSSNNNKILDLNNASVAKTTVAVLGNGNGTLLVSDSLDGENSSCIRSSSANDEDASEEEEDEQQHVAGDEHESSSNNSISQHHDQHKLLTMSSNNSLIMNDGTNNTNTNTDNESTLSSAAGGISTQKRALHCGDFIEDANSQPDLKKIKSD